MLERYAALTRELYMSLRRELLLRQGSAEAHTFGHHPIPMWDGGKDRYQRKFKPVWPKLAKFLLDNGCPIEPYLRAQICGYVLPSPNELCSQRALERYSVVRRENRRMIQCKWGNDLSQFRAYMASEVSWADNKVGLWIHCLLRPSSISYLFRFCVASAEPALHDLVPRFLELAVMQYLEDPEAYQAEWGKYLPPGFVDYVQGLRTQSGVRHG